MNEKKKTVEDVGVKFAKLDDSTKSFVLGYLLGKQEQAAKVEEKRPA